VILSSDNSTGGIDIIPGGSSGPWHGNFFTPPYEGSCRVGAMVRWPANVPAGIVSEELITSVDWYSTIATIVGAADKVPTDRPIDSVDVSEYLLGKAKSTGREFVMLAGPDGQMMSVKYGDIKIIFRYTNGMDQPIVKPTWPMVFDLSSDPQEKYNLLYEKCDMMWMYAPAFKALGEYKESIAKYPNLEPGEEFSGYGDGDGSHVHHNGKVKLAEYEHHHHVPG
jgi:arylsulfatase